MKLLSGILGEGDAVIREGSIEPRAFHLQE